VTTFVGLPPVREAVTIAEVGEVAIINPTFLQTDDPVFELDDFVVSGMVTGQAKAIAQQRAADNLTNVVASDAFGQFSDRNPAEALKRLPGVSIAEDQGEGRFIRIRGAGASLNSVSLDGVFAATPEENGRSTALNIISIDQLESIEVTKTWLPAQRANFIGGSVNLVTRSALDRDGRFASLESAWGQHEIAEDPSYRLNAVYGDSFQRGEHLLGFQLSVDFSEDNRGSDMLSIRQYDPEAGFEIGSSESDQIPEGLLFAGHSLEDYVITRERTGFSTKLEYRYGAHHEWSLAYSYNQFDDDEVRQTTSFSQDFGNFAGTRFLTASLAETLGLDLNDPVVQTRISRGNDRLRFSELQILGEMDFDPARGLYTKQTFNSTSNKSWRNSVTEDRVDTAQLNGLHTWDALDIAYKLYQSEADKTWTERRLSLGTPARASFVEIIDGLPQITVNDDAFSDPAIYLLNEQRGSVANNNFASIDERVGASLDLTARYEEGGWRFQTKAGIAHDEIDKVFTHDFQSFSEIESGAPNLELSLTDFDLDGGMLNDFLREEDGFDFGPQINTAAADDLLNFQDGPVTFAQTLNNITNGVTDAILRNYEASEAVTGFYVQQTMDWEAWRFIFGARFERTENTFTNNLVDPRSELLPTTVRFASPNFWAVLIDRVGPKAFITETTSGRDYNHLLPALHVIRRWDRLTLRAAYTQTIVRPQFDHLIPREIPSIDGARFGTSIQLPNFELDAQESENFDLSLDYEMEGISGVA